jgi:hypothetical protein
MRWAGLPFLASPGCGCPKHRGDGGESTARRTRLTQPECNRTRPHQLTLDATGLSLSRVKTLVCGHCPARDASRRRGPCRTLNQEAVCAVRTRSHEQVSALSALRCATISTCSPLLCTLRAESGTRQRRRLGLPLGDIRKCDSQDPVTRSFGAGEHVGGELPDCRVSLSAYRRRSRFAGRAYLLGIRLGSLLPLCSASAYRSMTRCSGSA